MSFENFQIHYRKWSIGHDHTYCKLVPLWKILRDHSYCRYSTVKNKPLIINLIKFKNITLYKFDCSARLQQYSCKKCKFKTYFSTFLAQHIWDFHNDLPQQHTSVNLQKLYSCRSCGFNTYSLLVWTKHFVKCLNPILKCVYCCNRCQFDCHRLTDLEWHQMYRHLTLIFPSYEKLACNLCKFIAVSESGLRTHKSVKHTGKSVTLRVHALQLQERIRLSTNKQRLMKKYFDHRLPPLARTIRWYKCGVCGFKSQQSRVVITHSCQKI